MKDTIKYGTGTYKTQVKDIYLVKPVILHDAVVIEGKPVRYALNPKESSDVYISLLHAGNKWGGWFRATDEYDVKEARNLYKLYEEQTNAR